MPGCAVRKAAGVLLVALFACAAALLLASPAQACSCVQPGVADSAGQADAVFVATASGSSGASRRETRVVTFAVSRVYKGQVTKRQRVRTAADDVTCGLVARRGARYLVFADAHGDQLHSSSCSVRQLTALETVIGLGPGAAPAPGGSQNAPPPWVVAAGLVAGSVATVVVFGVQRRRRGRSLPQATGV